MYGACIMEKLNEEITEQFIESMVDRVIKKLTKKLEALDISLDFIAAAMMGGGRTPVDVGRGQKFGSRAPKPAEMARKEDV
tara:strand:+ start:534 stop:776 length:243 start_codon:yes stop_codon:yes gene_type:complete